MPEREILIQTASALQSEVAAFRQEVREEAEFVGRLLRLLMFVVALGAMVALGVGITAWQGRAASRANNLILQQLDPEGQFQQVARRDGVQRVRQVNCLTLMVNGYEPKGCEDVRKILEAEFQVELQSAVRR